MWASLTGIALRDVITAVRPIRRPVRLCANAQMLQSSFDLIRLHSILAIHFVSLMSLPVFRLLGVAPVIELLRSVVKDFG